MAYTKQNWINAPDGTTPIYAVNMQHIEDGIAAIDATLAAHALPTWVQSTLVATLDAIAHPILLTVFYSSGWSIDATLQNDPHFAWMFVGGSASAPPPTTVGPAIWDRSDGTGIRVVIDEPVNT